MLSSGSLAEELVDDALNVRGIEQTVAVAIAQRTAGAGERVYCIRISSRRPRRYGQTPPLNSFSTNGWMSRASTSLSPFMSPGQHGGPAPVKT